MRNTRALNYQSVDKGQAPWWSNHLSIRGRARRLFFARAGLFLVAREIAQHLNHTSIIVEQIFGPNDSGKFHFGSPLEKKECCYTGSYTLHSNNCLATNEFVSSTVRIDLISSCDVTDPSLLTSSIDRIAACICISREISKRSFFHHSLRRSSFLLLRH